MSVPPGASYQASNTYVKLKRTLLKLEEPVRIQFKDEWEWGSPLYDWYHRRSCCLIKTMQLRKENNAPFFHEYVVFELYNGAGCFRIDRRQLPDETVPLDCIYEQGVEAYDTIEEVTSLGDSHYSPSDCLATIDVTPQSGPVLQLEFILKSLWAIHQDPSSRVYTLQRYNCYFVAQTIFLLAAKGGSSFRFEHYSLEDSSNKLPGLDWNAMYPSVAGGYSSIHASNRGVHYHFDPSPEIATCHIQALPLTLGHLLRQLRECDQGFHTMCIIHFDDCPFCLKLRAPFQAAPTPSGFNTARESSLGRLNRVYGNKGGLTLADITASGTNQSPESLVSNDSSRSCGTLELPMGLQSADATLSRFEGVILRFWRDCLSHALEVSNKDASNLIYTVCNTDTYLGQQKTLEQSVFELFDKTFALDAATRSSWSTCYHEALRKLARDLDPMVQRTLECLTWEPCLTPGVNPENVANPRRTENWVESMAMLLDSEFNRLEKALKVEMVALWVHRWNSKKIPTIYIHTYSSQPTVTSVQLGGEKERNTPKSQLPIVRSLWRWWERTTGSAHAVGLSELEVYVDALTQVHCARVEQYKFLLKCTSKEAFDGIHGTRKDIERVVRSSLKPRTCGLGFDLAGFSLPRIS